MNNFVRLSSQHYFETYPLPVSALHGRLSSMGFRDCPHHGKADACTACRDRPGFIHTVKSVKQPVQIRNVRQIAGVTHLHADPAAPVVKPHLNPAAVIGISDRVIKQYGYHSLNGILVSV